MVLSPHVKLSKRSPGQIIAGELLVILKASTDRPRNSAKAWTRNGTKVKDLTQFSLVMFLAWPKAPSQAKPGPFKPGQAKP